MSGFMMHSFDQAAFARLLAEPTPGQLSFIAERFEECMARNRHIRRGNCGWPEDQEDLKTAIGQRLGRSDWYGDLSQDAAEIWDLIISAGLTDERLEIGWHSSPFESVYWDVAEFLADAGATLFAEPTFGNRRFRDPKRTGGDPEWALYPQNALRELYRQIEQVQPQIAALSFDTLNLDPTDTDAALTDGSVKAQLLGGLIPWIRHCLQTKSVFFVVMDT